MAWEIWGGASKSAGNAWGMNAEDVETAFRRLGSINAPYQEPEGSYDHARLGALTCQASADPKFPSYSPRSFTWTSTPCVHTTTVNM